MDVSTRFPLTQLSTFLDDPNCSWKEYVNEVHRAKSVLLAELESIEDKETRKLYREAINDLNSRKTRDGFSEYMEIKNNKRLVLESHLKVATVTAAHDTIVERVMRKRKADSTGLPPPKRTCSSPGEIFDSYRESGDTVEIGSYEASGDTAEIGSYEESGDTVASQGEIAYDLQPPEHNEGFDSYQESGEFGPIVTRIKELRSSGSPGALSTLFWSVVDLRTQEYPDFPLPMNERGCTLLTGETITKLNEHFQSIMLDAQEKLSTSVVSLFEVLRSLVQYDRSEYSIAKLSNVLHRGGICALKLLFSDKLEGMERLWRDQGSEDELQSVEETLAACQAIDPDDSMTKWVCRKFYDAEDMLLMPSDPTERTIDAYCILPFSKLPVVSLRYGEGACKADAEDKKRRNSESKGKHVDFNHFLGGKEVGTGENAGVKPTQDKKDMDFVAGVKCSVALIRSYKQRIVSSCKENGIDAPQDIIEDLQNLAVPFYHVQGTVCMFFLVFAIGNELYGLKEWDFVDFGSMGESVDVILDMAWNFLCVQALHQSFEASRRYITLKVDKIIGRQKSQKLRTIWTIGSRGRGRHLSQPLRRRSWTAASVPIPGHTPKKGLGKI
ncbi:uncharacterized protein SPPG_05127 [Spizellomyces punctatus DAOM BR117]|uniref:Uncharacterized protein n=1 Tax=Spizellomyces punctatus (strain DAOM BR117) TaxID=645134 RepID=A0A0L0HF55_SPIPD|nr:uncharacterized protein SPPG_05127 [Spizellomyces punctatus DAOM BR117]KNC99747.1 hypothetical protein SPPG_05127 [Spizellomyces punctatus DAOM BR117]|eukprot:XP_016607787.1 hypothetical protein SPPG_05127 [Spizellomyces punctatus DAOM BR117]